MKAIRVHEFGGIDALVYEDVDQPAPGDGQVLVRVEAAGVGPCDAWVRNGSSAVAQRLPLIPGADLSGVVERAGPGTSFQPGEVVYGVTNAQFTGAYAEYAVASATMLARKPASIGFIEAASVPVVASTAWQMLFDYGDVDSTKRVLVHGGGGNVGAYAVQLAKRVPREVIATALRRVSRCSRLSASEFARPNVCETSVVLMPNGVVRVANGGNRPFAAWRPPMRSRTRWDVVRDQQLYSDFRNSTRSAFWAAVRFSAKN